MTIPTIDPASTNEQNALRLVEIIDRGTEDEIVEALKALLLIQRPELAALVFLLDGVLGRVAADGRVGSILSRLPILGRLFGRS